MYRRIPPRGTNDHSLCQKPGLGQVSALRVAMTRKQTASLVAPLPRDPTIRPVARQGLHTGCPKVPARCALHGRPRRRPIQPGFAAEIPKHDTSRKTAKSRSHGPHAKASGTCQHSHQKRPGWAQKTARSRRILYRLVCIFSIIFSTIRCGAKGISQRSCRRSIGSLMTRSLPASIAS